MLRAVLEVVFDSDVEVESGFPQLVFYSQIVDALGLPLLYSGQSSRVGAGLAVEGPGGEVTVPVAAEAPLVDEGEVLGSSAVRDLGYFYELVVGRGRVDRLFACGLFSTFQAWIPSRTFSFYCRL